MLNGDILKIYNDKEFLQISLSKTHKWFSQDYLYKKLKCNNKNCFCKRELFYDISSCSAEHLFLNFNDSLKVGALDILLLRKNVSDDLRVMSEK